MASIAVGLAALVEVIVESEVAVEVAGAVAEGASMAFEAFEATEAGGAIVEGVEAGIAEVEAVGETALEQLEALGPDTGEGTGLFRTELENLAEQELAEASTNPFDAVGSALTEALGEGEELIQTTRGAFTQAELEAEMALNPSMFPEGLPLSAPPMLPNPSLIAQAEPVLNMAGVNATEALGFTLRDALQALNSAGTVAGAVGGVVEVGKEIVDMIKDDKRAVSKNETVVGPDNKELDVYHLGTDLGKFVTLTEIDVRNGHSEAEAFQNVINNYPELEYLVEPVWQFEHDDKIVNDILDNISPYDGKSLSVDNMYHKVIDGITYWAIKDEVGDEIVIKQQEGLYSLYGEYGGPYSKNRRPLPNEPNRGKPIDFSDLAFALHDQAYTDDGYFSLGNGDAKLLNRLANNMDRMGDNEKKFATFASQYFSTVGHTIAQFKKNLPNNIADTSSDIITNDIFKALVGGSAGDNTTARTRFYKGLVDGLRDNFPHPSYTNSNQVSNACSRPELNYKVVAIHSG